MALYCDCDWLCAFDGVCGPVCLWVGDIAQGFGGRTGGQRLRLWGETRRDGEEMGRSRGGGSTEEEFRTGLMT